MPNKKSLNLNRVKNLLLVLPEFLLLRQRHKVGYIILFTLAGYAVYLSYILILVDPLTEETIAAKPRGLATEKVEKIMAWQVDRKQSLEQGIDLKAGNYFE